ncbi:MAG TPA: RidA family protein, partial [Gammaproteobacteria bacterium]|nr:RidA family protein [Gammaproteobacteria bacterium]
VGAASAGKLLFVSGCRDSAAGGPASGPIERQVAAVLDEVKAAMERAGSSLDKVVKTTLLLRDRHDYSAMRAAELAYYRRHAPQLVAAPPVSTFMQVAAIGDDPAARFEMDAIGVL